MMLAAAGGGVARVTRQAVKGSDAAVLRQELEDAEMKVEQCKVLIEFIDVFLCLSAYSWHALLERSRVHNHLLSLLTSFSVSLPIQGTLFLNAAVSTITQFIDVFLCLLRASTVWRVAR